MGLFARCVVCERIKLSSHVDRGVCSDCYAKLMAQDNTPPKETFDISACVKQESSDYTPPPASSDEPVYMFIDVETTGLSPTNDTIVQISALRFFGKQMVDGMNSYVNPLRPIPAKAIAIHGITDEKVKDSPTIDQLKEPFLNLAKGAILVGYNVTFDLEFLNIAFDGALTGMEYIDVMSIAKEILTLPNYRLETVADYVEFCPDGGYHDALTDCTATAAVFFRLDWDKPFFSRAYQPKAPAHQSRSFSPKDLIPAMLPDSFYHPLLGKKIVFTGELSISRLDAAQMATDVGAIVRTTVSGKTDYLVVGSQDASLVGVGGTSGSEKKAHELNSLGKAAIQIIGEQEFMSLLEGDT